MNDKISRIATLCDALAAVGSRVTCVPAPTNTDEDYLALVQTSERHSILMEALAADNWKLGGSLVLAREKKSPFLSFTLGELNLIVTESAYFYERFLVATALAKRLNVLDKEDRKAIFQAVLYGNEHNVHTVEPLS
jgi:hypothetical protein